MLSCIILSIWVRFDKVNIIKGDRMDTSKVEEKNSVYLDKTNIDLNDLKNTSLTNLDTSLKIQKQIIKHTSDGIIIGFYIKSKHAGLGLSNKVNSLYKTPALFPLFQEEQEEQEESIEENIDNIQSTNLFVKCGNKLIKVAVNTILYAHTDSKNYCTIVTSDGKKLSVRYSITSLLKALDCSLFTQTHRSYIINWQKIDSFHEYDQTMEIQGYHIPVGRTYKEDLYKKMRVI